MVKRIPYFIELIGSLKWVHHYGITTLANNQDLFLFRQNPCLFLSTKSKKTKLFWSFVFLRTGLP